MVRRRCRLIWGHINRGLGDHMNGAAEVPIDMGDINHGRGDHVNPCDGAVIDMG